MEAKKRKMMREEREREKMNEVKWIKTKSRNKIILDDDYNGGGCDDDVKKEREREKQRNRKKGKWMIKKIERLSSE